jgi:peptidoglycan hydrolase CwlO-like protein
MVLATSTAFGVTEDDVAAAKAQLDAANAAVDEATEVYYEALDAHDAAVEARDAAKKELDETKAKLEEKQGHLATRAKSMYRTGSPTLMDVIFGSSSFEEFANTWNLLTDMNENDAKLIEEIKDLKAKAEAAYEEYVEQEKLAAQHLKESEEAKTQVEALAAEYQNVYESLSAELQAQIIAEQQAAAAAAAQAEAEAAQAYYEEYGYAEDADGDGYADSGSSDGGGYSYVNNGGSAGGLNYEWALTQVGKSYNWGSTGPNAYDCSGLAYAAGAPYRSSSALYANAKSRVPVSEAQAGDVLWVNGHVGISLGGNRYVHASDYGTGVIVSENANSAFTYALRY